MKLVINQTMFSPDVKIQTGIYLLGQSKLETWSAMKSLIPCLRLGEAAKHSRKKLLVQRLHKKILAVT